MSRPVAPGTVVWLTGLPATGKSTVARLLRGELLGLGVPTLLLDGDDLREVITPQPTYSDSERDRFYGGVGRLAELAASGGSVAIVAATAPRRRYRDAVRERVDRFIEVLLIADPAILEQRDPKGLYAASNAGVIDRLPGRGAPYEDPRSPELVFDTSRSHASAIAMEIAAEVLRNGRPAHQHPQREAVTPR